MVKMKNYYMMILYRKKKLKLSNDKNLNDLIIKTLKININERISWDDYFNHPFFNQDNFDLTQFEFTCQKHSKEIFCYCKNCKKNICKILFNRAFFS